MWVSECEEIIEGVDKLATQEKAAEKDLERLSKQLSQSKKPRKPTLEESQKLKQLLQQKQELQKQAEEIQKQLNNTLKKERQEPLLDEGTLFKLEQVRELFQELSREMMMQMKDMEMMAKQTKNLNPDQLKSMMKKFDKQKFSSEVERALEALKKIKAKRKLTKNIEKLKKLAKEHAEVDKAIAKNDKMPDKRQLDSMQQRFENIERDLNQLANDEGTPDEMKKAIEKALQKAGTEIKKQWSKARKAERNGNKKQMQEANAAMMKQMMKMQSELQDANQKSDQETMRVNIEELMLFLSETLQQGRFILDLKKKIVFLDRKEQKRFAARNLSMLQGSSRNLASQMELAYKDNLTFKKLTMKLSRMLENSIKSATAAYGSDTPPRDTIPIDNLGRLNNQLATLLLTLLEKLKDQQEQNQMSQFMESLEQLSNQQQQVNQGTKSAQSAMGKSERQRMMEQMAFQQQLVRESTEKLYEQYRQKLDLAGKLQGIGKEMKAVEKRLKDGDSGEKTQEKQKRIEYKLLEAQDAIKEQNESKKRRSNAATAQGEQSGSITDPKGKDAVVLELIRQEKLNPKFKTIMEGYFEELQQ